MRMITLMGTAAAALTAAMVFAAPANADLVCRQVCDDYGLCRSRCLDRGVTASTCTTATGTITTIIAARASNCTDRGLALKSGSDL
jgi:hypothetical protein